MNARASAVGGEDAGGGSPTEERVGAVANGGGVTSPDPVTLRLIEVSALAGAVVGVAIAIPNALDSSRTIGEIALRLVEASERGKAAVLEQAEVEGRRSSAENDTCRSAKDGCDCSAGSVVAGPSRSSRVDVPVGGPIEDGPAEEGQTAARSSLRGRLGPRESLQSAPAPLFSAAPDGTDSRRLDKVGDDTGTATSLPAGETSSK